MNSEKLLTFEFIAEEEMLAINLNKEGICSLIDRLNELLNSRDEQDHIHLMTNSWGGNDLSEVPNAPAVF